MLQIKNRKNYLNWAFDEVQSDIGDSDKEDDTNELTLLLKGVEIYQIPKIPLIQIE